MNNCKICNKELENKKRIYCSNKCKFSDKEYNKSRVCGEKNEKNKKIKCKICNWETIDILNKSGIITEHLKTHNLSFDRNDYLNSFEIITLPPPEYLKCSICDWKTEDVRNVSGIFTNHIIKFHNLNVIDFIDKYPSYNHLWKTLQEKQKLKQFIDLDEKNRIKCFVCNKFFKKLSNTHLIKHGITPTQYKIKYNIDNTASEYTSDIQSEITFKNNIERGGFGDNISSLEEDFSEKLKKINIQFITPFLYEGKKYDFYIPSINSVIEIDGETYHKDKLEFLTVQTINGSVNDYEKNSIMSNTKFNFYRIRYNIDLIFNNENELKTLLDNNKYTPSYTLIYKQKICKKEYFEKFLECKDKLELKKYSDKFVKFIRTFHPTFPYPDLEENLDDVIKTISKYDLQKNYDIQNGGFSSNISIIGNNYLKHNFHSYWKSGFNGSLSPEREWLNDKTMKEVIEYRIGCNNSNEIFDFSLHQLIRGLSARRFTTSFFKPLLATSIYYYYLIENKVPVVLDPCCGYGGRLLGFKSKYPNGKYVGCEPNIETYNEIIKLKNDAQWKDVEIYNCKFEDFKSDIIFDLVFTSIPYYNTEIYSNNTEYKSFDDWKNTFVLSVERYKGKNCYINTTSKLAEELGWNDIDNYILLNRSHFDDKPGYKKEVIVKL